MVKKIIGDKNILKISDLKNFYIKYYLNFEAELKLL